MANSCGKKVKGETARLLADAANRNPYNRMFKAYVVLAIGDLLK